MLPRDVPRHSVQPNGNAQLGEQMRLPQMVANLPQQPEPQRLRSDAQTEITTRVRLAGAHGLVGVKSNRDALLFPQHRTAARELADTTRLSRAGLGSQEIHLVRRLAQQRSAQRNHDRVATRKKRLGRFNLAVPEPRRRVLIAREAGAQCLPVDPLFLAARLAGPLAQMRHERVEQRIDGRRREAREPAEPHANVRFERSQIGCVHLDAERPEKRELLRLLQVAEFFDENFPGAWVTLVPAFPTHVIERRCLRHARLHLVEKFRQRRAALIPVRPRTAIRH